MNARTDRRWLLIAALGAWACGGDGGSDAGSDAGTSADAGSDAGPAVEHPPVWLEANWTVRHPAARDVSRMAYDAERDALWLVGGQSMGPLPIGDTWRWDDEWAAVSPDGLPKRKNFGIAFDRRRGRVVVFAGLVGGLVVTPEALADTWEWDGVAWSEVDTTDAPAPRAGHAMVYDEARAEVVVFGGTDNETHYDDTYTYDGTNWTRRDAAIHPPTRFNTVMVYDSARQRVLLFGGLNASGEALNDLWAWDGASWTDVTPSGSELPEGRGFFAMAYDRRRDRVVLYGGTTTWPPFISSSNTFDDLWEYDGAQWTRIAAQGPGRRAGHEMAYDEDMQQIVLFGGSPDGTSALDDTWLYYACGEGEIRCREGARIECRDGVWTEIEDCFGAGLDCTYGERSGSEVGPAHCTAPSGCAAHRPETAITRFDPLILNRYVVDTVGARGGTNFDRLVLIHDADVPALATIVDPRTEGVGPVRLFATRGTTAFQATAGAVELISVGDESWEPYQVRITGAVFQEIVMGPDGNTFVEGASPECMQDVAIDSVVLPYLCRDIVAEPAIGETACYDRTDHSVVVRCESGFVSSSSGNLGALVMQADCTAMGGTCQASETGAACVVE